MIRCGRLAVEGEEEEVIAVPPRTSKPKQRVRKSSSNPFSSRGLDEFARLSDELSAKRELISRKTGIPLELVRFSHSSTGWKPVVFKSGGNGGSGRVLIPPPIKPKEQHESQNRTDGNRGDENDIGRVLVLPPIRLKDQKESQNRTDGNYIGEGENNGSAKKEDSLSVNILPWWSVYLKTAVFGVLSLSVIMSRKSALRAAAMAGVILIGYLQRWLQDFVRLVSVFSKPLHCKGETKSTKGIVLAAADNKVAGEYGFQGDSLVSLTAPSSPTVFSKDIISQEANTKLENEKTCNKKKKFERIVSMDGGAEKKPIRVQEAEIFLKRRKARSGTVDATAMATVMIIVLFFLVFYGRLAAICLTSVWWYVLPIFRTKGVNVPHNGRVNMDLQSREYRRKIYN